MCRILPFLFVLTFLGLQACAQQHDHGAAMLREHAGDSMSATPAVQPPTDSVTTRTVGYGPASGSLSSPVDTAGVRAGLIVIHEWWGLNPNIVGMTERFAGEGYHALAVDLYGGEVAETPERARELSQATTGDVAALQANLRAAYHYLTDSLGVEKVGIVGWCMGGFAALQGALALPEELDAAVIYYGNVSGPTAEQLATLTMPLLGLFGEADRGIPVEQVRAFEARLQEAGRDAEIVIYPGAGHAFANPTGNNYQAEAAEDAWTRTTDFFRTHLQ